MLWILAILAGIIYICVQVYQYVFWAAIVVIIIVIIILYVLLKILIHIIKAIADKIYKEFSK